jgi:hypothetical protein
MLKMMPGITPSNYHLIIDEFDDLVQLCQAPLAKLVELLGQIHGSKLHKFLTEA